jgi:DNA repair protein RecN (Recombination protein N)
MEEINGRLSKIYQLQKKHAVKSNSQLLDLQNDLQAKVDRVSNLDEEVIDKKNQAEKALQELMIKAEALSASRKKAAPKIKSTLEELLREVGMPNATVEIVIKPIQPVSNGIDLVSILFSANKGIAAQELKNSASGGEFSRLMLCIKYLLTSKTALPTIVFDEIDTGISGEIAMKVGKMMQQMAASHQVIAISHLPQIAAKGSAHYFVYKDDSGGKTISKVRRLTEAERIKEIAEMIGGKQPSETAVKNAKELLAVD